MSEKSMPWDADLQPDGTYDKTFHAADFAALFASFWNNGVFDNPEDALQPVNESGGMSISVKAGRAHINGHFYVNTEEKTFVVPEADSVNPRKDSIILRMEAEKKEITLQYATGVPAVVPVAPDLVRTGTVYDLRIAEITVTANAIEISMSNIKDTRVDKAMCGIVSVIAVQKFLEHFADLKNPHKVTLDQVLGSSGSKGIVPVASGGTGADTAADARKNMGITAANIGAAPSGHTHNYAGSSSAGGAANTAVKLQTPRVIKIGSQSINFDGSTNITFNAPAMGLPDRSHSHNSLRNTNFINTGYSSSYDDGTMLTFGDFLIFESNLLDGTENMIYMKYENPMFFNGWSITGGDFEFNGDVKVHYDLYCDTCVERSDERIKNNIADTDDRYEELFKRLRPVTFKYNDGNSGRTHTGFISQEVEQAILDSGLTTLDFAAFVKLPKFGDKNITETYEEVNEETREIETKTRTVKVVDKENILDYEYKLRYDEFISLNTHMIQKLMARVDELEQRLEVLEGGTN